MAFLSEFGSKSALWYEINAFLTYEARLLDERRFEDWLELFTDDARYCIPVRGSGRAGFAAGTAGTHGANELAIMDDDKSMLEKRVARIRSGVAWAEEPPSVTVHIIANVDIGKVDEEQRELEVRSAVFIYRAQLQTEREFIVGRRRDLLVQKAEGWRIRRREVELADSVLGMKNLSIFL